MTKTNEQAQKIEVAFPVSKHITHANCKELLYLLYKVDVNNATVTRGTKNPKEVKLVTDKELELISAFESTGFNIKQTAEKLGFSHTNVWQRLYGNGKTEKPSKGILGKLKEYYHEVTAPMPVEEIVSEDIEEAV